MLGKWWGVRKKERKTNLGSSWATSPERSFGSTTISTCLEMCAIWWNSFWSCCLVITTANHIIIIFRFWNLQLVKNNKKENQIKPWSSFFFVFFQERGKNKNQILITRFTAHELKKIKVSCMLMRCKWGKIKKRKGRR